jgi:hypothetical protein
MSLENFDGSTVWPDLGIVTRLLRCITMHGGAQRHIRIDIGYLLPIHFIFDSKAFRFGLNALNESSGF